MQKHENMPMLNFTTEEINLVAIYKVDTLAATIVAIDEAMPDILDEDIISIAESAIRKLYELSTLSDSEYAALIFTPADETEAEPDEGVNISGATIEGDNTKGGAYAKVIQESAE